MGYNGEISNPLGTDNFLQLFDKSDIDDTCQIINDIYNKLIDELKEDSIKKFAKYNNSRELLTPLKAGVVHIGQITVYVLNGIKLTAIMNF